MSERNETMAAMLAADAPAARDFAFRLTVMAKIEQRRFRRGLVRNITLTAAATALLALVAPDIEPSLQQAMSGIGSGLAIALLSAASVALPWWSARRA